MLILRIILMEETGNFLMIIKTTSPTLVTRIRKTRLITIAGKKKKEKKKDILSVKVQEETERRHRLC